MSNPYHELPRGPNAFYRAKGTVITGGTFTAMTGGSVTNPNSSHTGGGGAAHVPRDPSDYPSQFAYAEDTRIHNGEFLVMTGGHYQHREQQWKGQAAQAAERYPAHAYSNSPNYHGMPQPQIYGKGYYDMHQGQPTTPFGCDPRGYQGSMPQGYSSHYQEPPPSKPSKSKHKHRAPVPESSSSSDEEESLSTTLDRTHLSDQKSHYQTAHLHLSSAAAFAAERPAPSLKAQSARNKDLPTLPSGTYIPLTPMPSNERLDYRRSETEPPASYSAYSTIPPSSSKTTGKKTRRHGS